MEFVQVILNSLIAILVVSMFVGSLVMAGSFCWYHGVVIAMTILAVILLVLAIKEYKQSTK